MQKEETHAHNGRKHTYITSTLSKRANALSMKPKQAKEVRSRVGVRTGLQPDLCRSMEMAMTLLLKRSPADVGALEAGEGSGGTGVELELTTQGGEATEVVRWMLVVVAVEAGTCGSGSGSCTCTGKPPLPFFPAETTQDNNKSNQLVIRYPPCPPLQASLCVHIAH